MPSTPAPAPASGFGSGARAALAASRWQGPALRAAVIWPVLTLAYLAGQPFRAYAHAARSDYLAFMVGGRLVGGGGCLYCMPAQYRMQTVIVGGAPDGGWRPFVNPPLAALVLKPLAELPLHTSIAVFMVMTVAAMVLAASLLHRLSSPVAAADRLPALCVVIAAGSLIPAADGVGEGQWTGLTLLAACAAMVALRGDREVLAGLLLSTILVKPQLVWLVPPALLIAGRRRALAGFCAGCAMWSVSTLMLVGVPGVGDWLRTNALFQADAVGRTVGVPALAGGSAGFGLAAAAAALSIAVMWCRRAWLRADAEVAVSAGLLASVFCSPHAFQGDLMLLAIPIVIWSRREAAGALVITAAVGIAGVLDAVVPGPLARFEVAVMVGLFAIAAARGGPASYVPEPVAHGTLGEA